MIKNEMMGTWCVIPSPEVTSIICKAGFDFVIVDMEHGSMDYTLAQRMVTSAQAEGKKAIIRVSRNDESNILRSLDIGSDGIIVPHIKSVEDVNKCISYSKYPPIGNRGYTPYTKSGGYSVTDSYQEKENKESFVGIILEDEAGLKNIERCTRIVRDAGKSVGCLFHNEKELNYFKDIGINFLVYSVDSGILYNSISNVKNWRV